jgi:hypothetical protein
VRIHENTRVLEVKHGDPCTLRTARHVVRAKWTIVATQMPVIPEGLFFARAFPQAHPVIAAPCEDVEPTGMYITAGKPSRSFRFARRGDVTFIVAAGEIFKPGETASQARAFRGLADWLARTFGVKDAPFRWVNEDFEPMDGTALRGRGHRQDPAPAGRHRLQRLGADHQRRLRAPARRHDPGPDASAGQDLRRDAPARQGRGRASRWRTPGPASRWSATGC